MIGPDGTLYVGIRSLDDQSGIFSLMAMMNPQSNPDDSIIPDNTPDNKNISNTVNAATEKTVGMQKTGLPLAGLILAVLALFSGLATSKRK